MEVQKIYQCQSIFWGYWGVCWMHVALKSRHFLSLFCSMTALEHLSCENQWRAPSMFKAQNWPVNNEGLPVPMIWESHSDSTLRKIFLSFSVFLRLCQHGRVKLKHICSNNMFLVSYIMQLPRSVSIHKYLYYIYLMYTNVFISFRQMYLFHLY